MRSLKIALAPIFAFAVAGCFTLKIQDGLVKCSPGSRPCPEGYFCSNGACYQNGEKAATPTPATTATVDMVSQPVDMSTTLDTAQPKDKGTMCKNNSECASGFCTDGFCCDQACGSQCQACDITPGTCMTAVGIPHGVRAACPGSGTCGATCDGMNLGCTYPGVMTSCGNQTCGGAPPTLTFGAACNGTGQCVSSGGVMSVPCSAPANATPTCNGTQCSYACNAPYTKMGAGCQAVFTLDTSNTKVNLATIWGANANTVYAAGYDATNGRAILALNSQTKTTWSSSGQTIPSTGYNVALWGDSASNIYLLGWFGSWIFHSSGGGLWPNDTTAQTSFDDEFVAIWGSGVNNDIWMTGVSIKFNAQAARVRRHSNSGWADEAVGITGQVTLRAVWGSSDTDIYTASDDGRILHSSGNGSWGTPQQTTGTTNGLSGLWGSDASHIYAVGDMGTILFSAGDGQWHAQPSGTTAALSAVWGSGANDIYAVGAKGTILHSAGDGKWTPQVSNTTQDLKSIWGSGPTNVYVVGNGGVITHFHQ